MSTKQLLGKKTESNEPKFNFESRFKLNTPKMLAGGILFSIFTLQVVSGHLSCKDFKSIYEKAKG